jgi:hypothetical protein
MHNPLFFAFAAAVLFAGTSVEQLLYFVATRFLAKTAWLRFGDDRRVPLSANVLAQFSGTAPVADISALMLLPAGVHQRSMLTALRMPESTDAGSHIIYANHQDLEVVVRLAFALSFTRRASYALARFRFSVDGAGVTIRTSVLPQPGTMYWLGTLLFFCGMCFEGSIYFFALPVMLALVGVVNGVFAANRIRPIADDVRNQLVSELQRLS